MITLDEAHNLAKEHLLRRGVRFSECERVLEFPDGSVTFHFAKPDRRFYRNGNLVEVCESPGTVIVMVDRTDGRVGMPDQL